MKLTPRDRKALVALGAAVALIVLLRFLLPSPEAQPVVAAEDSVAAAAKRLARVRRLAEALPEREKALKAVTAELAAREKGLIQAETAAQAQAQLLQLVRRLMGAQNPPVEIRSVEVGQTRQLGEGYAEVTVPVSFECRIEQLVNLLADVTAQTELAAVRELRITAADQKSKTVNVRMVAAAVAPGRLAPAKQGTGLE